MPRNLSTNPSLALQKRADLIQGMVLMAIAMLIIPGIDVFAKLLTETMSAGQIVWFRFFIQSLIADPDYFVFKTLDVAKGNILAASIARIIPGRRHRSSFLRH